MQSWKGVVIPLADMYKISLKIATNDRDFKRVSLYGELTKDELENP